MLIVLQGSDGLKMTRSTREPLTAEFVRSILDYDSQTGVFRWKYRADYPSRWNTKWGGKEAGSAVKGYRQIQIGHARNYYCHVLAWLYVYGEWRPKEVDHRNRDRSDNRIDNLRLATESENGCNKAMQRNNTSGVAGVHWLAQARRWQAVISKNGRKMWCKNFRTLDEAAEARRQMLPRIHGEFATECNHRGADMVG